MTRLVHDYALNAEPDDNQLARIAQDIGLKSRIKTLSWDDLYKVGEAFPVLCKLENGNWVTLVGIKEEDGEEQVLIIDPLASEAEIMTVSREKFEAAWAGTILLLKKNRKLMDEDQPFGFKWFIPEAMRHKLLFGEVAIAALLMHVLALATPVFFQVTLDKVVGSQVMDTLYVLTAGVLVALTFNAIIEYLRGLLLLYATSKMDVRIGAKTFDKLLKLPIDYFRATSAGVVTKHMGQTSTVREFLTGRVFLTFLDASAVLIYLPVLFFYSSELSFIVLGFTLVISAVTLVVMGPYKKRLSALYKAEGERQSMLVECISGMETVKALALEPIKARQWSDRLAEAVTMNLGVGKISHLVRGVTKYFGQLMGIAIIFVGVQLVFSGDVSIGALIAFNMLSARVSGPLIALVGLLNEFQQTAISVKMLGQVMNQKPEQAAVGGLTPEFDGEIEFDDVSFQYGKDAPPALDHISFKIKANTKVGIVGRSGSGKSSVLRLLQGFYRPNSGLIRLDGTDMREIDLAHIRINTGVILQESFLFKGTVRENIAATRPDASFSEIVEAAKLAGADEFIQKLAQGYDSMLEEGAANLSGGQKQRLAIARALLRQPKFLIMDEATSALDPESEAIIQANLREISAGRTVVMVSHRLSMLVDCDQILVVDQGGVIAEGRHEELLSSCELYYHLWTTQNPSFKQAAQ